MDDHVTKNFPEKLEDIVEATKAMEFDMAYEPKTGAFLRSLAASKPGGNFLEIGTGTGLSAAWILQGMSSDSMLTSIDNDEAAQEVAQRYLATESQENCRLKLICADGAAWLEQNQQQRYDFIFADAFPGKFSKLQLALNLLNVGGMYIIDDMLPQANWPDGHAPRVPALMERIESMTDFTSVRMTWASGLMLITRIA